MSHNATGYDEDMNPDMIDGIQRPRDQWAAKNVETRCCGRRRSWDGWIRSRIVYHHASGNLGSMHAINFYPNFVPIQELSDWFEHWATKGVKPVFTCEYGAPFTWDWTMYRGWYKGQREWGSAQVPWEFCLAEWNSQFLGDRAYQISEAEKTNLRWEAKQFRAGKTVASVGLSESSGLGAFRGAISDFRDVSAGQLARVSDLGSVSEFRLGSTGISGNCERRWIESGANSKVDWEHLQRPGFSPITSTNDYERMDIVV